VSLVRTAVTGAKAWPPVGMRKVMGAGWVAAGPSSMTTTAQPLFD
jgi:hypothetical protein